MPPFPTPLSSVFPAYAGVFPSKCGYKTFAKRLPRIRGGVSARKAPSVPHEGSSPHTRGCFLSKPGNKKARLVFPAYAGVFLPHFFFSTCCDSLPRIRGGVSPASAGHGLNLQSSPHTRGCFSHAEPRPRAPSVFPAYAGVFLKQIAGVLGIPGLPRIRGGVSYVRALADRIGKSSPHTRGCFLTTDSAISRLSVFPAYAGVFLNDRFSDIAIEVFPAYAGVFLLRFVMNLVMPRLPRIRGGVSSA